MQFIFRVLRTYKTIIVSALVLLSLLYYISMKSVKHRESDVLVVGISPDYPPFEFVDKHQEVLGFDVSLINAIAKKLNKEVKIKSMEFYSLIPSLKTGKVDLIISAISNNNARLENVDFSQPYYKTYFAAVVEQNSSISSLDMLSKGARIGVQIGSIMESFANELKKNLDTNGIFSSGIKVIAASSNFVLLEKLRSGELDALIVEQHQAARFARENSSYKLSYFVIDKEYSLAYQGQEYAIGIRKNSPLLEDVNNAIREISKSGELDEMLDLWGLN